MIDADIRTITPDWIVKLAHPIFSKRADFVSPEYARSPFEGNTTNHFCFPLLYAWFGFSPSQPIGGDFGMSQRFYSQILLLKKPRTAYQYGVDIFLTIQALKGRYRISTAFLGVKIHNPSFGKIDYMFNQVAVTLVYSLTGAQSDNRRSRKIAVKSFVSSQSAPLISKLEEVKKRAERQMLKKGVINSELRSCVSSLHGASWEDARRTWLASLASTLMYIKTNKKITTRGAQEMVRGLSPVFLLWVVACIKKLRNTTEHARSKLASDLIRQEAIFARKSLVSIDKHPQDMYGVPGSLLSLLLRKGART